jgi:hypothetical protein
MSAESLGAIDKHDLREPKVMTPRCTLLSTMAVLTAAAAMPSGMVVAQNNATKTDNTAARAS